MDDDEFNTLKFKLPFLLKKDKDQFYLCVSLLKTQIPNMTFFQLIDLFYTFHALNISRIWVSFLKDIFDILPISYQIDIIKFSCSCSDDHVEELKNLIDVLFSNISKEANRDQLILELSFMNSKFFKPILSSKLRSIKFINKNLSLYISEKSLAIISDSDTKLKCLEKLRQFRSLNENEIQYILSLLSSSSEYTGRILDMCLRSDNPLLLNKAYEILLEGKSENLYVDKNSVHFFEIKPEILKIINETSLEDLIMHIEELLDISRLMLDNLENMYYLTNLILTSNYKIDNVSIEKIFTFLWTQCDFDDKKSFIDELSTYDISTCCYGLLINALIYIGAIKDKEFLAINKMNKIEQIAVEKMKTIYPIDDDFWTNVELVEKTLKETMASIFAFET